MHTARLLHQTGFQVYNGSVQIIFLYERSMLRPYDTMRPLLNRLKILMVSVHLAVRFSLMPLQARLIDKPVRTRIMLCTGDPMGRPYGC
jgi:predicted Na+-dependent transporter